MSATEKINLLDFNRSALEAFFVSNGEKPFRARQLMQWVHQRGVTDFSLMTDMSKSLREFLNTNCCIERPRILTHQRASDGTRKWLLSVDDSDNAIECVLIPEKSRMTLCISSQLGCTLNCSFCATAKQGFNRNLTTAEIIAQLHFAHHSLLAEGYAQGVTNVVMMGMGEPLLNFDAVIAAVDMMCDDYGYALSKRRVTISTAGVVPAMEKLEQSTDVALAVSLHAPNDRLRNQLVPINRKYPIRELLRACHSYIDGYKSRKITFEYVMLDGVNDSLEHARQLVGLIRDIPCKLNLIPFNPYEHAIYRCSEEEAIDRFRDYTASKGIVTVTRRARGDDIDAACGQLVGAFHDRSRRSEKYQLSLKEIKGIRLANEKLIMLLLLSGLLQACVAVDPAKGRNEEASDVNTEMGLGYLQQNNYELANEKLLKALRQNPESVKANYVYAVLQDKLEQKELAEFHYQKATELDPKNSEAANNFGAFLCRNGRELESEKYFKRSVANPLYKTPEFAYFNAAICLLKIDQVQPGKEYLGKALAAKSDFGPALLAMGDLLYKEGDYSNAKIYLDRYHLISQPSARSLWLAIRNTLELDDQGDIEELAQRLESDFPDSQEYVEWKQIQ